MLGQQRIFFKGHDMLKGLSQQCSRASVPLLYPAALRQCRCRVITSNATPSGQPKEGPADPLSLRIPTSNPGLSGPFVRPAPLISYERTGVCGRCQGTSLVPCSVCSGSGRLPAGGYHARNPIASARIVNSAWTAMERTLGWRHFRVTQKRKQGKDTFVLMVATCDENVQLWVNIKNLKDRAAWAAGWLQKAELRALEGQAAGAECKGCKGTGNVACPLCALAGLVVEL